MEDVLPGSADCSLGSPPPPAVGKRPHCITTCIGVIIIVIDDDGDGYDDTNDEDSDGDDDDCDLCESPHAV